MVAANRADSAHRRRSGNSLFCHEGGGLSANIRGDQVLVGSAAFMKLMKVKLPQGLKPDGPAQPLGGGDGLGKGEQPLPAQKGGQKSLVLPVPLFP